MSAAISLEDVGLRYEAHQVLKDFSLHVESGEALALLGPSGCGKSSVLRVVLGLIAPATGLVRLNGEIVSADSRILKPPEERGIAVVFQDLALWPHMTVAGNLAFGLKSMKIPKAERRTRIEAGLERVGLADRAASYPSELSGGERQRVAIARALVLEPRAVLLDEPLANLDIGLKRELLATFRELLREQEVTTLYVTHDMQEAAALGDRIAVLEHGQVVQQGSLDQLRAAPATSFVRDLLSGAMCPPVVSDK